MTPVFELLTKRFLAMSAAVVLTMGAVGAVSATMASAAEGDEWDGDMTITNIDVTCGDGVATSISYTVTNGIMSGDAYLRVFDFEERLNGNLRAGGEGTVLEAEESYNGGDNLDPNDPPSQSGTPGDAPAFTIEATGTFEPGAELSSLATVTVENPCLAAESEESSDDPEAAEPKPEAPKVAPRSGM